MKRILVCILGLSIGASGAWADTLIYEGTISARLGGDTLLRFSLCVDDVCAPALGSRLLGEQAADGGFTHEISGVTQLLLADATHLRVELERGGERFELVRQPLSRALMRPSGCLPAPSAALTVSTAPGPGEFGSIADALASLDRVCIGADQIVRIEIAEGTFVLGGPVRVQHPQGGRIHIIGAGSADEGTVLTAANGAFEISNGHRLGLLHGVRITGPGEAGEDVSMITASQGATLVLGDDVRIDNAGSRGLHAVDGGSIVADRVRVLGCAGDGVGVMAESGGFIRAHGASVISCGRGFVAEDGGQVIANNARAATNDLEGFLARNGSLLINRRTGGFSNCDTGEEGEGCGGAYRHRAAAGFRCEDGATLIASNSASNTNETGFLAESCVLVNDGGEASDNSQDGVRAHHGAIASIPGTRLHRNAENGVTLAQRSVGRTDRIDAAANGRAPFITDRYYDEAAAAAMAYCKTVDQNGSLDATRLLEGENGVEACQRALSNREAPACMAITRAYFYVELSGDPIHRVEASNEGRDLSCDTRAAAVDNPHHFGLWACCERGGG